MACMDITSTYLFLNAFASPFCDPAVSPGGMSPGPAFALDAARGLALPSPAPSPLLSPRPPHNTPATPDAAPLDPAPLPALPALSGGVAGTGTETEGDAAALAALAALLAPAASAASAASSPSAGLASAGLASAGLAPAPVPATSASPTASPTASPAVSASSASGAQVPAPAPARLPLFATCNCGHVRVTVRRAPALVVVCQCACCRRFGGGVAAHLASFSGDEVTVSGALRGHWRGRVLREFCAACGCAVRVSVSPVSPGGPGGGTLLCAGLLPPGVVGDVPWRIGFCGGE